MKITQSLPSHKNAVNLAFPLCPFHLHGEEEPGNVTDYAEYLVFCSTFESYSSITSKRCCKWTKVEDNHFQELEKWGYPIRRVFRLVSKRKNSFCTLVLPSPTHKKL